MAGTALAAGAAAPFVGPWEGGAPGLAAGAAFSFVSLAAGHHGIRWGASRGGSAFLAAVVGATVARVVALPVFALGLAFGTDAHLAVALVTVVVLHVVFGIVEIVYLKRTGTLE